MAEATYSYEDCESQIVATAALTPGEVIQLGDGRAGVVPGAGETVAVDDSVAIQVEGVFVVAKTASIVFLDGQEVYWDHSANTATYIPVNDRDFYIGTAVGDAASAATTMSVNLNVKPHYSIDMARDAMFSVPTGTQVVGAFGFPKVLGGARQLELTATSEVQCIDILSVDRRAVASKGIFEAVFRPVVNGSGAAVDFSIGLANGTSASDADAITNHVLFHIDGSSTAINAQSKDGTTTVTATDTTATISAGSAVANRTHVMIDTRDPSDCGLYVNGVQVLPGTTFDLSAATGPMGILAHLEKSTGTTTGNFVIDFMRLRTSEQSAA